MLKNDPSMRKKQKCCDDTLFVLWFAGITFRCHFSEIMREFLQRQNTGVPLDHHHVCMDTCVHNLVGGGVCLCTCVFECMCVCMVHACCTLKVCNHKWSLLSRFFLWFKFLLLPISYLLLPVSLVPDT